MGPALPTTPRPPLQTVAEMVVGRSLTSTPDPVAEHLLAAGLEEERRPLPLNSLNVVGVLATRPHPPPHFRHTAYSGVPSVGRK